MRNHHSPEGPEGTQEMSGGVGVKVLGQKGALEENDGNLNEEAWVLVNEIVPILGLFVVTNVPE